MGRLLFFVILGLVVYFAFRAWRSGRRSLPGTAKPGPERSTAEPMVRCAHCGLNVPRSEALADADRWFCSDAHRRIVRDAS
jgi:uncharacterized protein